MDINYELYKVFYYVGRTLSFSEASRLLFISQSAVSQSIKTLEKKLDHTLFDRSTKKVVMTKEGEILFKYVESAVNLLIRGENQMCGNDDIYAGQLRIAANDTICRYYLVPFINKLHRAFPQVKITVRNGTSSTCAEYLANNEVDLIITNSPNAGLSGMAKVVEIREFTDVFVASRKAFAEIEHPIGYDELSRMPIMMLERNTTTSTYLHDIFLKKGIDLVPDIELSSNDLLIDLAKIGLGIAFVPDYCVRPMPQELFEIKLEENINPRKLVAAYSEQLPLSDIAGHFLNLMQAEQEGISDVRTTKKG